MGPLVSEVQYHKVLSILEKAKADGCTVESCSPSGCPPGGYYIPPTMLTNVSTDSNAWIEEIFGPVLAVRSFTTEEEAISLANATTYGLANAVFSADTVRLGRVASKLKSGLVWRNCSQPVFPVSAKNILPGFLLFLRVISFMFFREHHLEEGQGNKVVLDENKASRD
jgi:betaine-aldehyde dehydrogenase